MGGKKKSWHSTQEMPESGTCGSKLRAWLPLCEVPDDQNFNENDKLYCVNCKNYGHPASYRECPILKAIQKNIKINRQQIKTTRKNENTTLYDKKKVPDTLHSQTFRQKTDISDNARQTLQPQHHLLNPSTFPLILPKHVDIWNQNPPATINTLEKIETALEYSLNKFKDEMVATISSMLLNTQTQVSQNAEDIKILKNSLLKNKNK